MSEEIQPFNFEGFEVRFVGTAEDPEWVAADIITVLYPDSTSENRSNYLSSVPSEWKGNKKVNTPGGRQSMVTLFEPGFYALVARSNSPRAVPFQKWVYEQVLPSIRKTGSYSLPTHQASPPLLPPVKERLDNIRLGLDLMYELGGVDERTQLALKDIIRDMLLEDKLKKPALPHGGRNEVPVSDRARALGYKPTKKELQQIGRVAAKLYRVANDGQDPPRREQYVDGTTRMVFCYSEADIEILDNAIALVMEKPAQLPPSDDEF